jgi:hypothetical protein
MKASKNKSGKAVGLAKAWGAYIQMLVQAIVKRQMKISETAK